jgi:hypothetical protein
VSKRASRCSGGSPVEFIWAGPGAAPSDPIEKVLAHFESLMKRDDLYWEPRHWAITKSELKNLLKRASQGRLKPVVHIKDIDRGAGEFVFEIIYDFNIVRVSADGTRAHKKARVRLYISEPPNYPGQIVGLHLHEKVVANDNRETNRLQNIEIDKAIQKYKDGRPNNWGIQNLAPQPEDE